jgi:hypothetical protein
MFGRVLVTFQKCLMLAIGFGVLAINGAETIIGRVVNGSKTALAGARVWIKGNPSVFDSTGIDGKFLLVRTASAIASSSMYQWALAQK